MSTKNVTIAVPAAPGFGAAADISDLVGVKTVQLAGTFAGSYVLYVSHDGSGYAPLLSFDAGGPEGLKKTFSGAFRYAKLLSRASGSSGVAATVSGLEEVGANTFVSETLPAGFSGVSPVEDLGFVAYQEDLCALAVGSFTGELVMEGSLDGANFNPIGSYKAQPPQAGLLGPSALEFSPMPVGFKIRYVRATLLGAATTALVLSVGGRQDTTLSPAEAAAVEALLPSALSGEAVAAGRAVGLADSGGSARFYNATAASAAPVACVGLALAAAGGAGVAVTLRTIGLSDVLPDAAWVAVPAVTDVGKTVYLARDAGKSFTLDVSGYGSTDLVQPLGVLEAGGAGATQIMLEIQPARRGADDLLPVVPYAVASRTVTMADVAAQARDNFATTVSVTLPSDATLPELKVGSWGFASPIGAGKVTYVADGGVTINAAFGYLSSGAQYANTAWVKTAADTYMIFGLTAP